MCVWRPSTLSFEMGSSINWELTNQFRLAGQQAAGFCHLHFRSARITCVHCSARPFSVDSGY